MLTRCIGAVVQTLADVPNSLNPLSSSSTSAEAASAKKNQTHTPAELQPKQADTSKGEPDKVSAAAQGKLVISISVLPSREF